jgi:hypothetical protein
MAALTLSQILQAVPRQEPIHVYHGGQHMDELHNQFMDDRRADQADTFHGDQQAQIAHENQFQTDRELTRQNELASGRAEDTRRWDYDSQNKALHTAYPLLQNPDTFQEGMATLRQAGFGVETGEPAKQAPAPYLPENASTPAATPAALPEAPQTAEHPIAETLSGTPAAQAPVTPAPAPALTLGDIGKQGPVTSITSPSGQPLMQADYGQLHQHQLQRAQAEFDVLARTGGPLDQRAAHQASALIGPALVRHGYNSTEAAKEVLQTYYKLQNLDHVDPRAAAALAMQGQRIAATQSRGQGMDDAKWYKDGEMSAARTFTQGKYNTHLEAYNTIGRALQKIETAPDNPATYISVVYDLGHSNDPGARMTDKDVQLAPGLTSLLGKTEEQLTLWFEGSQGAEHIAQIKQHLQLQKGLIERQNLDDAQSLVEQYKQQPTDPHRRGFGSVLSRYSAMPFYGALQGELGSAQPQQDMPMGGSSHESSSVSGDAQTLDEMGLLN